MKLVGVYNAPALVTMAGLICGFMAIWCAFKGEPEFAVVSLIWAGIFDLFDGLVARRKQRSQLESEFGVQVDSLVDMVSFGVAPIFVAFSLGLNSIWAATVCAIYLSAVAQRLAYFNVLQNKQEGTVKVYTGLPVTFAALIFGLGFSLMTILKTSLQQPFLIILFAIMSSLYLIPLKIPKPKGLIYIFMPLLAILFSAYWLMLALRMQG